MTNKLNLFLAIGCVFPCCFFCSASGCRDPFTFVGRDGTCVSAMVTVESKDELVGLAGVIESGFGLGAILTKGLKKEVVFLNDAIWGYKVKTVAMDHVVLLKEKKEIKILI